LCEPLGPVVRPDPTVPVFLPTASFNAAPKATVSALNQTKLISDAIRKGAQDFIAKPFLPEHLQETMASCVQEAVAV